MRQNACNGAILNTPFVGGPPASIAGYTAAERIRAGWQRWLSIACPAVLPAAETNSAVGIRCGPLADSIGRCCRSRLLLFAGTFLPARVRHGLGRHGLMPDEAFNYVK